MTGPKLLRVLSRLSPMMKFWLLFVATCCAVAFGIRIDSVLLLCLSVLSFLVLAYLIKCRWCGSSIMIRYKQWGRHERPTYTFPFDSDCAGATTPCGSILLRCHHEAAIPERTASLPVGEMRQSVPVR